MVKGKARQNEGLCERGSGIIIQLGSVQSLKFWLFYFPFLSCPRTLTVVHGVSCLKRDVFILLHFPFLEEYHPFATRIPWLDLPLENVFLFSVPF